MAKLEINYLYIYAKQLNELKHDLLHLKEKFEVKVNRADAESFIKVLEELKTVVENLPLA